MNLDEIGVSQIQIAPFHEQSNVDERTLILRKCWINRGPDISFSAHHVSM